MVAYEVVCSSVIKLMMGLQDKSKANIGIKANKIINLPLFK